MRTAVYAGTFDPVTLGHLSVIERAAPLFERLIVIVAVNPTKAPMFDVAERVELLRATTGHLRGIEVEATTGLVVDLARTRGASVLIRGIRGESDASYETALANANHALAPELTTIFLPAHPELSRVSSTALKELARAGGALDGICPPAVRVALLRKTTSPPSREAQTGPEDGAPIGGPR